MDTKQKRTYLVFTRGIMPGKLRLGSLHVNPANPQGPESHRWTSDFTPNQLDCWTGEAEIERPISIEVRAGREWLVAAGLFQLLRGELARSKTVEVKVEGEHGRRVEIDRPEAFLKDVVLRSAEARTWLGTQFSAIRQMSIFKRLHRTMSKAPRIWMVTGLQYVTKAHISTCQTMSSSTSVGATVPLPDIAAAITQLNIIDMDVSSGRSEASGIISYHPDERVWAAQFSPLAFSYLQNIGQDPESQLTHLIQLREPPDLGVEGIRRAECDDDGKAHEVAGQTFCQIIGLDCAKETCEEGEESTVLEEVLDVDWEQYGKHLFLD